MECLLGQRRIKTCTEGITVANVRRLKFVEPGEGNFLAVRNFGYKRFAYFLHEKEDACIDCISQSFIQGTVVFVRYPLNVTRRHGFETKFRSISDSKEERKPSRIFELKNIEYTSLGESPRDVYLWNGLILP